MLEATSNMEYSIWNKDGSKFKVWFGFSSPKVLSLPQAWRCMDILITRIKCIQLKLLSVGGGGGNNWERGQIAAEEFYRSCKRCVSKLTKDEEQSERSNS